MTLPMALSRENANTSEETDLFVCNDPARKWFVLHSRSRREKKIAERCSNFAILCYLPLRRSVTGRRGRRYTAMVPIFPGYVFVYMDRTERRFLLQTNHIARVIDVVDQDRLIEELKRIRRVEVSGSFLHPVSKLTKGTRVRIIEGPLSGLAGTVRRVKGRHCIVLEVHIIQQAVACEVDAGMVVPAQ